jgi:hypothetical protein
MIDNSVCMKCRSLEKKNEIRKICKTLLFVHQGREIILSFREKNCRRGRLRPRQDKLMDVKGQAILREE